MTAKILLIDDDCLAHFISKKLFQGQYPEEDTIFFDSALPALDYLKMNKHREDILYVILLDINMPAINGWQFMELLKDQYSNLNFKIHLLSSSIDKEDQRKAQECDYVHSYIVKPLNKTRVLQIVDSLPAKHSRVKN